MCQTLWEWAADQTCPCNNLYWTHLDIWTGGQVVRESKQKVVPKDNLQNWCALIYRESFVARRVFSVSLSRVYQPMSEQQSRQTANPERVALSKSSAYCCAQSGLKRYPSQEINNTYKYLLLLFPTIFVIHHASIRYDQAGNSQPWQRSARPTPTSGNQTYPIFFLSIFIPKYNSGMFWGREKEIV